MSTLEQIRSQKEYTDLEAVIVTFSFYEREARGDERNIVSEKDAEEYAALKAERDALKEENDVMYAAILEASELGVSAALRCKVELQRIARNEALKAGTK